MESAVERAEASSSYITFIQFPRTFDPNMMGARNPGKDQGLTCGHAWMPACVCGQMTDDRGARRTRKCAGEGFLRPDGRAAAGEAGSDGKFQEVSARCRLLSQRAARTEITP